MTSATPYEPGREPDPPPPDTAPPAVAPRSHRAAAVGPRHKVALALGGAAVAAVLCCAGLALVGILNGPSRPEDDTSSVMAPARETPGPGAVASADATPSGSASTPSTSPTTLHYADCDAVRAAGKAPLYRHQPGYRSALDPDGDGVACARDSPPTTGGTTAATTGVDPRYDNCKEARAHGYGPYRRGVDPEYQWYRDPDKDGVVCA